MWGFDSPRPHHQVMRTTLRAIQTAAFSQMKAAFVVLTPCFGRVFRPLAQVCIGRTRGTGATELDSAGSRPTDRARLSGQP